ncbi:MAG: glycosyltransferase family 4 protein [Bacteroidales bacterium]|nr:glycosyltransferase family 4 protein [Bacteroidales bacterium]
MKILFLCNKSPWPPKEGGPMAMNMLVEGLIEAGHSVKILAVNSYKYNIPARDIPQPYIEKTGIELIDVDLRVKIRDGLINLFTGRSYHVQRFISRDFSKRLEAVLRADEYDIVQMETLYMSPYLEMVREHSHALIFLRAHNIEHRIWQRITEETTNPFRRWYIRHLAKTLKTYELGIIHSYDGIVAISPTDADYFRGIMLEKNQKLSFAHSPAIIDIPFGIDPKSYEITNEDMEFPSLFTLGAMNWIPNQDGIRWFLTNVWPDIHKQFPSLKYYLAGREMPEWMQSLDLDNIEVLGEVEDAKTFISSKAIMIVPLFSGSGIRIKIIEGLSMGKVIISTSMGAEGIKCKNGKNILIADQPCEFFEMISIAVGDRALCEKIGKEARELIETKYNSRSLIQKLVGFYQQVNW